MNKGAAALESLRLILPQFMVLVLTIYLALPRKVSLEIFSPCLDLKSFFWGLWVKLAFGISV